MREGVVTFCAIMGNDYNKLQIIKASGKAFCICFDAGSYIILNCMCTVHIAVTHLQ